MIRDVLLDLDDTILDFHLSENKAIKQTLHDFALPDDDETARLYSRFNDSVWKKLEKGEMTREEILVERFRLLVQALGADADPCTINERYRVYLSRGSDLLPGAETLLKTLYGRYRLFIVSNGSTVIQQHRLSGAGIERYFEGIFFSEAIGADKPSKLFFDRCFARIENFEREKAVLVGDSLTSDILGGINAGVRTCWFNPSGRKAENVRPDREFHTLEELPAILETL